MPRFRPERLLTTAGIPYTVSRGNAYFACPWCRREGHDEKGDNFGIRLDGKAWGCWRSRRHSGPLPYVLRFITGWSSRQVDEYLGGVAYGSSPIGDLKKQLRALGKEEIKAPQSLEMPEEFHSPKPRGPTRRFYAYLKRRGFARPSEVVRAYDLRCATSGPFQGRLIIPIYVGPDLIGWTGRAIGRARLRYYAYEEDYRIKDHLYNIGRLPEGRALIVVEGPFDAIKLEHSCRGLDVSVAALMGTEWTRAQVSELVQWVPEYDRFGVLFDHSADLEARKFRDHVPFTQPDLLMLPRGVKDPGDLSEEAARNLVVSWLRA